jgi:hypothetical protein
MPSHTTHAAEDTTISSFEGVRTATVNGAALAYREQGEGEPVVYDLATPVRIAEAASVRHRWALHVIEDAADDPTIDQPEAFLDALRNALGEEGR